MAVYNDISPLVDGRNKLINYEFEYDEEAIKNSLLNIFTVAKGDCPGKPQFGNPLNIHVFDLFTFFNTNDLETAIINEIEKYEPRVKVYSVVVDEAPEYNRIIVTINFSYVLESAINYDSLAIPYTHNSISYLGGRIDPANPPKNLAVCKTPNKAQR